MAALFFIDVDYFKSINDTHGHEVGDVVLHAIARRLRARVREDDLLARLGGDEFAALLYPLDDPTQAERIAQSMMDGMRQPIGLPEGATLQASLSVGVAFLPVAPNDTLAGWMKYADQAMYAAKRAGRGRYVVFSGATENGGKKMSKFNVLLGLVLLCLAACQSVPGKVGNLTEQQVAALKEVGFVQDADDWVFSASDKLLFGSNEAELTEEAKQTVYRITHQLMQVGIMAVRVDGHTDATGSRSQNQQLSQRRAEAVAERMRAAGMKPDQIRVRGLGSEFPVADNRSESGKAQNRRVVLVVGD